jgi:hypothetical protein
MAKFDFGQVNGKRFQSNNNWVADEDAWTGTSITPMQDSPLLKPILDHPQSTWDKVKALDISGLTRDINPKQIFSQLSQGLAHGLSQTGTVKMSNSFDEMMASSKDQAAASFGNQGLTNRKIQQSYLDAHPVNSIAATIGEQIPQLPLWMGGEQAVGMVGKGLAKAFPSLLPMAEKAGSIIPKFIQGGLKDAVTYGTVVSPVDSIKRGDNFSQFLDRESQLPGVFLGGSALRGVGQIGGMAGKGFKDATAVNPYARGNGMGVPSTPTPQTIIPTPAVRPPVQPPSVAPVVGPPTMGGPLNRFEVRLEQRVQGSPIPNTPLREIPIKQAEPLGKYGDISKLDDNSFKGLVDALQADNDDKLNALINHYTSYKPRGVEQGGIGTNVDGDVVSKWGRSSNNEPWYQAAYQEFGHKPSKIELKQFAENELRNGRNSPLEGNIPADKSFLQNEQDILNLVNKRNTPIAPAMSEATIAPRIESTATTPQQPNIGEPRIVSERGFSGNVRESQVAPEGIKQNTLDNPLTYEPITNRETLLKANTIVETDAVKARELFDAPSKGISADDVALGESLIVKAIKDGDTVGANKLIADLAEKLTTAGQAVQAASIFKRLTPGGMLLYAQRVVNSANKELLNRLGLKAPKVELTAEDSKFITDTMTRVQKLGDGDEKNVAMAQVMKLISEKVPATLTDKIKALQRISLLLNPKTMNRNILGNTVFGAIDNVSNVVATPIDILASKLFKTPRTTTLPSIPGQLKSMAEGVKLTARDAKLGIDTYHTKTQYEFSGKRNFNNAALNKLDRATIVGLKLGDTPFHKAAYDDVLRQQMKLSKTDKPTQAMKDQAQSIADQRTYQDVNDMTEAFKMVQKALNKVSSSVGLGNAEFGLGNFVTPFVKTPANILKRAVEYSPVGITTAIKEATKINKGKFDQKAFVDSISRSVTGTALIMVGYDLAKRGMITGSGNKDKDVAAFERGLGKNDYAYKYGDKLYTYDWMQPGSMSLAIGADVYIKGKDRKQAENVVIDAVKSGGETLFKQSLLQGVTRFMSGYSPMDNVATTAINAPPQFIPTIAKQLSQVKDPTQRSTYSDTKLGTGGNLLKARIPGMTESLEPKINTSGEKVQTFQGNNSLANIFVNPGSSTTFKPNDVQKEILRIYETTGDKTIFPRVAPKSLTIKGETFKLTPKEMTSFQQSLGKSTEARMRDVIKYKEPGTFSQQEIDDRKVKELAKAIEKAYEDSKESFVLNRK